jgi:hypothetical protein
MKRVAGGVFCTPANPIAHRRRQEKNFHRSLSFIVGNPKGWWMIPIEILKV